MEPPYCSRARLERNLPFDASAFDLTETEWGDLLDERLAVESERVEGYLGFDYRDETIAETDVPETVKNAVMRLARDGIQQINQEGRSSESSGDGASASFRPSEEIQMEVRRELQRQELEDPLADTTTTESDVARLI